VGGAELITSESLRRSSPERPQFGERHDLVAGRAAHLLRAIAVRTMAGEAAGRLSRRREGQSDGIIKTTVLLS
jgi:hypothetical protein